MRIFKTKSIISELILSVLFFLILISLPACSNEDDLKPNLSYLSFDKEVNETKLTVNELKLITEAFKRLEIYREDGLYKSKYTSGSEVNISNKLFEYVIYSINNTNKIFLKSDKRYKSVRFKTGVVEAAPQQTDCVARAIARGLAGSLTYTYEEVNGYIVATYGNNGVKLGDVNDVCSNFFPYGNSVSPSQISSGSMNNMILVIQTSDGGLHAVNGTFSNGSDILYYDAQNERQGYCSVDAVVAAYALYGE